MHGIEGHQNLSSEELGLLMGKDILFNEQVHQISPRQVLHNEVKVVRVLEGALEAYNPRVFVGIGEYISLLSGLHHFIFEDHFAFLEFFDCYWFARLVPPAQPHFSESSLPDDSDWFEIVDGYFFTFLAQLHCLLVCDLFFDLLLFELGHAEGGHLVVELFPVLLLLLFELYHFGVALFYEIFGCFYFFLGGFGNRNVFEFLRHSTIQTIKLFFKYFKTKGITNIHNTLTKT